ncbi:MAG: 50S ribosomal protein L23 [Candidatus Sungiibacteriota bacterium]
MGKKDEKRDLQPAAVLPRAAASLDTESREEITPREDKDFLHTEENSMRGVGADILIAPHTTEKTTDFSAHGIYVFKVAALANKRTVASAVAARYGVAVDCVRVAVQPAKERRRGRQIGWKRGFKKAMVQLKEGQKIEML